MTTPNLLLELESQTLTNGNLAPVLPPRRNSFEAISFEPLTLPSPSSVAPLGLFSQPPDVQPLQTFASLQMNEFAADQIEERAIDPALPPALSAQIAGGAAKHTWEHSFALENSHSNVLIRTPMDQVHQMVPCTPGPATTGKACLETELVPVETAHGGEHFDAFQGIENDSADFFLHGASKAADTYLFGSSDEDAVSGEIQLNHVTGYSDVFSEGSSPVMIRLASLTSKKAGKRTRPISTKSARTAKAPKPAKKGRTTKTPESPSRSTMRLRGKTATVASAPEIMASKSKSTASRKSQRALEVDPALDVMSPDLKTPTASQQSQGHRSQRSSGKKKTPKSLAGRPLNTPIVKKIKKSGGARRPANRRPHVPWIFGVVNCPRTGRVLAEGQVPPGEFCTQCNVTTTPVWRAGPFGHKTLCNACGVRWMKQLPSQRQK